MDVSKVEKENRLRYYFKDRVRNIFKTLNIDIFVLFIISNQKSSEKWNSQS